MNISSLSTRVLGALVVASVVLTAVSAGATEKRKLKRTITSKAEKKKPAINENPLVAVPSLQPFELAPGGTSRVVIQLDLDPLYHAYKDKFSLKVLEPAGLGLSGFQVQPMVKFYDKLAKKEKEGLSEKGQAVATLTVPANFSGHSKEIILELGYQACAEDHCLFPKKLKLKVPVSWLQAGKPSPSPGLVSGSAATPAMAAAPPSATPAAPRDSSRFQEAMEEGLLFGFLFVFVAGLLTSLTPCVFPMIPITLSIIGARTAGQSRWKGFVLSVFYTLGIAITYAVLGVIAAKSGALFGGLLANPWVVGSIAVLFVVMGLSMYGLFELQVPAFIRDRLAATKTERGYLGAFVAGLIAGVVASPCIGPVLVVILTYVAQTQNIVLGFFLLFTYALGLGVLFIVLGTFSGLLSTMPRAGVWMDAIKFVFGTGMIAMAIFYLAPVVSREVLFFLSGVACILISSAYGAFAPAELMNVKASMKKGVLFAAFLIGVGLVIGSLGIFGGSEVPGNLVQEVSSKAGTLSAGQSHGLSFKPYSDKEFEASLGQGRPILIDFRADWCVACKELEAFTFSDTAVQAEAAQFVVLQVDATNETEENARIQRKFKIVGLPTLLFFSPTGNPREDLTLTGFESASQFLERLKRTRENR